MSDLIDTTQMYLRTVYELIEEGVPPMRARIAERLHQAGPTVSQTVGRMERDGLLTVNEDRIIELSPSGRTQAERVMRKHRIAERFLADVLSLAPALVHEEACKLEHVLSQRVEERLFGLLNRPTESPFGNPIPALGELGAAVLAEEFLMGVTPLANVVKTQPGRFVLRRVSEAAQADHDLLALLQDAGVVPGAEIQAWTDRGGALELRSDKPDGCRVGPDVAHLLFVELT